MIDFETIYEQKSMGSQLQPKPLEILFDSFFLSNQPFRYGSNAIICGFQRSITLPSSVIRRYTIPNPRNPGKEAGLVQK